MSMECKQMNHNLNTAITQRHIYAIIKLYAINKQIIIIVRDIETYLNTYAKQNNNYEKGVFR